MIVTHEPQLTYLRMDSGGQKCKQLIESLHQIAGDGTVLEPVLVGALPLLGHGAEPLHSRGPQDLLRGRVWRQLPPACQ